MAVKQQEPSQVLPSPSADLDMDAEKLPTGSSELPELASNNLSSSETIVEAEFHHRTWLAVVALLFLNYVQVFCLLGPPQILTNVATNLKGESVQSWIPNAATLVQATFAPIISSASDLFQARKILLLTSTTLAFIGSAIGPGSQGMPRIIASQILIGCGLASVPLAYAIPSEILPKRWRPMVQAAVNLSASLGAITGPIIGGAFIENDLINGWRKFWWLEMALWGTSGILLLLFYRPLKRQGEFDHLSSWQKLKKLDFVGFTLFLAGLVLFLVGLNLGGGLHPWVSGPTLGTLCSGLVSLLLFGIYEWKGTNTGMLSHELFKGGRNEGRTFAICIGLIFVEGILLFAYLIFFPVLTGALYETRPVLQAVRGEAFWIASAASTVVYGYWSQRWKTIRGPLFVGFLLFTAGTVGLATLTPADSVRAEVFAALAGLGMGSPLVVAMTGVQLATPHRLIATASATTATARAVAATIFTAINSTVLNQRLGSYIPSSIARAAISAGLPPTSLPAFIPALLSQSQALMAQVPGVSNEIVGAAADALKTAYADGIRVVFIIAAPFGLLACIGSLFLGDLSSKMTDVVEAPVEELRSRKETKSDMEG